MSYTRLKDNVPAINWAIAKNRIGETTTIVDGETQTTVKMLSEDLANFVEVGTTLANLDPEQFESFMKDVVTGVARTEWITGEYTAETHGIVKTVEKYNGALQRCAMKNIPEVQKSSIRNLVSGVNYIDGKFYGFDIDAKIWSDEFMFKVAYSIGYDDAAARWNTPEEANRLLAEIEIAVHNAMEIKLKGIADTVLNKGIVDAYTGGRRVRLISRFNQYYGYTGDNAKTLDDIKANKELRKEFSIFCDMAMGLIEGNMKMMSKKYNDGTVPMFTPGNRIQKVGLIEFKKLLNNMEYDTNSSIPDMDTTLCWQSFGQDMLPLIGDTTDVIKDGTFTLNEAGTAVTADNGTTYSKIAMYMYDDDSMGVSKVLDKVTVERVGAEGFDTYFEHYAIRQYIDERQNSVVFTLD